MRNANARIMGRRGFGPLDSLLFMHKLLEKGSVHGHRPSGQKDSCRRNPRLEDFLLAAQVASGAQVRDTEDDQVLILTSDIPERKLAVFKPEAAAISVITHFGNLILKRRAREVIARAEF